ncbi:hypothetical protein FQN60_001661, partial [Etheostoma spectabile]
KQFIHLHNPVLHLFSITSLLRCPNHREFHDDQQSDAEETQQDDPDAITAHAGQPRNPEGEMVSEMGTSADANSEQTDQSKDPENEKEELRPGLALDTCMQPPDPAEELLSYGYGISSIAPSQESPILLPVVTETHLATNS